MAELVTAADLERFDAANVDEIDGIFERNMTDCDIDWDAAEIGAVPVLAHYYVKGEDMHYYVLSRVHDDEDDLLTCVNVSRGQRQLILFPVRMFNGAVLDDETQEHAFAEEKLFGQVCLRDMLN